MPFSNHKPFRPNGTIIFSVRRCQTLSLAISDDEGDSWRFVDVPGSKLPRTPFSLSGRSSLIPLAAFNLLIATYLVNGNVLTPKGVRRSHDDFYLKF